MMGAEAMSAFFSMKWLYCCTNLSGSGSGVPASLRITLSHDSCEFRPFSADWMSALLCAGLSA